MEEFIYLYESMPYNIELMNRPLEDIFRKSNESVLPVGLSGERGMYHAFAPQYKAGIRFWQYDGGSELSSCVSV